MKVGSVLLGLVSMGSLLFALTGCQTTSPGVKDELGTYVAWVDGTPEKVTEAARGAVEDMKLAAITSVSTTIDGKVTAKTAEGQAVTIDVIQAGTGVSKVTVRAGIAGDEVISQTILDSMKKKLR